MAFIKIVRPINFFFVIITTLFGALYPNFNSINRFMIFAAISAALISAGGYVVNDYFDRNIDKINRPNRMIPSGKISAKNAYLLGIFLFISGLSLSFFTAKLSCVAMAFLNTWFLFFYAKSLKMKFLTGNLTVAYAAASTFIFGAFVTNNIKNIIAISVIAFLFTLIREFIKDAQDYKGDRRFGARTMAVILGQKAMIKYSIATLFLIAAFIGYAYSVKIISTAILIAHIILVLIPVFMILKDLSKKMDDRSFGVSSNFFKFDMIIVILIFYFGR